MSSNMERVAAMPDASLYVNRDGRRADDCVDSHGGGNLIKIPRSGGGTQKSFPATSDRKEVSPSRKGWSQFESSRSHQKILSHHSL